MQLLNRDIQREQLFALAERYPELAISVFDTDNLHSPESVNLHYLEEHGLVLLERSKDQDMLRGTPRDLHYRIEEKLTGAAKITARGMDFVMDDGGLTEILGTVTVRLHGDTIRDLIETRIAESEAPPAEKKRMIHKVKEMPEEGLKHLATRLIDYGLAQGPNAWQALSGWLS